MKPDGRLLVFESNRSGRYALYTLPATGGTPRRISGTCALHQRKLQNAIKRARIAALLPFTAD